MLLLPIALLLAVPTPGAATWPDDVEAALMFAGPNRVEIERALRHFADGDEVPFEATR